MIKKRIILSLFFIAYAIVLGHDIIPHHHHDDLNSAISISEHDEEFHHIHTDSNENEGSHNLFSYFNHSANKIIVDNEFVLTLSKEKSNFLAFKDFFNCSREIILIEETNLNAPFENSFKPEVHFVSSFGLRAPPAQLS